MPKSLDPSVWDICAVVIAVVSFFRDRPLISWSQYQEAEKAFREALGRGPHDNLPKDLLAIAVELGLNPDRAHRIAIAFYRARFPGSTSEIVLPAGLARDQVAALKWHWRIAGFRKKRALKREFEAFRRALKETGATKKQP